MKSYRKDLDNIQSGRMKNNPTSFIILGVIYSLLGLYRLYINFDNFGFSILWLLTGLGMVTAGVLNKKQNNKYFIELNNFGIKAQLSFLKSIDIKWDEINSIHYKPISLLFHLKNHKTEEISLGNFSYQNVLEFKEKVDEFAKEFNVPIK